MEMEKKLHHSHMIGMTVTMYVVDGKRLLRVTFSSPTVTASSAPLSFSVLKNSISINFIHCSGGCLYIFNKFYRVS